MATLMPTYSFETLFEIWNDNTGDSIQVGPDRDGLGLIEIRYKGSDGKIVERVTFDKEQAKLIQKALENLLKEED